MIRLKLSIDSLILHEPIEIQVAMPQLLTFKDTKLKCVFGLHCHCSNSDIFFNRLNIEDYVEKYGCAFISTNLSNSYYLNSRLNNVADFLDYELYPYIKNILPLSENKEDNFCIGISMGAFGALSWALRKNNFFSKIACVSGFFDPNLALSDGLKKQRSSYILTRLSTPYIQEAFTGGNASLNEILGKSTNSKIGYDTYQESANLISLIEQSDPSLFDIDFY